MKGVATVLEQLQVLLTSELTASDQYFMHSRLYDDWGLSKLYTRMDHESEEEKHHADLIVKRMLFLEGSPDVSKRDAVRIGGTVKEAMQFDLELEYDVADALKSVITLCEQESDFVTRDMLMILLKDTEEDHAKWLEQQLWQMDNLGVPNYLQSQL